MTNKLILKCPTGTKLELVVDVEYYGRVLKKGMIVLREQNQFDCMGSVRCNHTRLFDGWTYIRLSALKFA